MSGAAVKQQLTNNRFSKLRGEILLTRPLFCRMLSVSERSLADYETSKKKPGESVLRKLRELERLMEELRKTIDTEFLNTWIKEPNKAFDGLKPIEVIERGEVDRIWRMIYFVRSGQPG